MRILALADIESKSLWDYFESSKLENIDLILSAGDLKAEYLTFLASFAKVPLLYIHGNHDGPYLQKAPEGCICIEDTVFTYKGLRIVGLGGSCKYSNKSFQYTERQMQWRIAKMSLKSLFYKPVDILLTHSPGQNYNLATDKAHRGFSCFDRFYDLYKPKVHVHGHVHMNYSYKQQREIFVEEKGLRIINAYERHIFEI